METKNIAYLYDTENLKIDYNGSFSSIISIIGKEDIIKSISEKYMPQISSITYVNTNELNNWFKEEANCQFSFELFADLLNNKDDINLVMNVTETPYTKFIFFIELFIFNDSNILSSDKIKYINSLYTQLEKNTIQKFPFISINEAHSVLSNIQNIYRTDHKLISYIKNGIERIDENYDLLIKLQQRNTNHFLLYNYIQILPVISLLYNKNNINTVFSSAECQQSYNQTIKSLSESKQNKYFNYLNLQFKNNLNKEFELFIRFIGWNIINIFDIIDRTHDEKMLPENIKYIFLLIWSIFQRKETSWFVHQTLYVKTQNIIESLKNELL